MSIQLNSNIKVVAPAPIDTRYLSVRTSGGNPLPYSGLTEVISTIPSSQRYIGLTVNINNVEYWFQNGIADSNLVIKSTTGGTSVNAVTGATNIGYFSGQTGVQTLLLSGFGGGHDGSYYSQYNNYYLDNSGFVRIGTSTNNGVLRRAYVNTARTISWIYSTYNTYPIGWILSTVDVTANIGNQVPVATYVGTPYTQTIWSGFNTNGSNSITASGSLTTGTTITIGSPIYNNKLYNQLRFRTITSKTPNLIKITNDDSFIYFSGTSSSTIGNNVGSGAAVYSGVSGNVLKYRTIIGTGSTTVTQTPTQIIISSSTGGTSTGGTTNAVNIGTGIGIYNTKVGNVLQFNSIIGSGGTSVSQIGNNIVVSGGSSTYNLGSPSVIPVGGICAGTVLAGKTSFQLWEELLVPELCGSVTPPSIGINLSNSGLYEIGCCFSSQVVTGNFSRGSISPQYCSASPYASGLPISYCFTGTGMPSGFQTCAGLTATEIDSNYTVISGTQSWGVCTCYSAGSPALGSKGTQYAAAIPAGCTSAVSASIVGAYPLWATTATIAPPYTKQPLVNMSTANNIQINLVTESGGYKQTFQIPCAWLSVPRPLVGVCQFNTVSNCWTYPNGSAICSLCLWTCSSANETVQGNLIGYCQYTYNGVDRSAVCIMLVF